LLLIRGTWYRHTCVAVLSGILAVAVLLYNRWVVAGIDCVTENEEERLAPQRGTDINRSVNPTPTPARLRWRP